MTREQRLVGLGAASGILTMFGALWLLSAWLPGLQGNAVIGERLAYAARWNALAAIPLFLAIASVANARFKSKAIDPTLGLETREMIINGRVVDNTVQQYVIFVVANCAVASGVRGDQIALVGAAAASFVVMRFAFWIGYRIDPLYRAFGMAGTSYLNLTLLGFAAWLAWN